jgi:hypothetical protein
MRHSGIPLPEPVINNNLLIGIVVFLGLVILLLLTQPRSLLKNSIMGLSNHSDHWAKNATAGDLFRNYLLFLFSIAGLSLYASKVIMPQYITWEKIGIIYLGISVFLATKILLTHLYLKLFFGKDSQLYTFHYINLSILLGISSYVSFIFLQFSPFISPLIIHIVMAIISICYVLIFVYLLFKLFFNKACLFFHFILYLCTLEILPILAIAKSIA